MRKFFIAVMAVLLSFSAADASAQSLKDIGRSIGRSIVNGIKKSAQNKQQRSDDNKNNDSQQQVGELFSAAELPEFTAPDTTYQYNPNDPTTGEAYGSFEWIDLGLPSGVRWATRSYGGALSWGKTNTDVEYCIRNSRYYGQDISNGDISGNHNYDVASLNMGRGWRTPRIQDLQELLANCDREYTTERDVAGIRFTSRINGQSIFMTVTGYRDGWNHNYKDEGYYWLSASGPDNYTAHVFKFSSSDNGTIMLAQRYLGCCIHPVMDRPEPIVRRVGNVNGHDWVDLGLPSGTRWATCNVGATKPSQPGKLYAWGEIQTKSTYTEANSKFNNDPDPTDIAGTDFDVAHVNWGNGWKMPTREQLHELVDCCSWDYVELDGRWTVKLTSYYNNAVIYLPATGHMDGTRLCEGNGCGNYWSSTPTKGDGAHGYNFGAAMGTMGGGCRYYGMAIRPVLDKASHLETPVSGQHNDHDWVDLGLPSGTKWATCNIGAKYADQDGYYYAWGEITAKHQTEAPKNNLSGHEVPQICGNPQYDAATANWGSGWQTPTIDQFNELIEHCTWEWTTLCDRKGYKVTSKVNDNWIFFTTSGFGGDNFHDPYDRPNNIDKQGSYWSSTNMEGSSFSCSLGFSARLLTINTQGMSHRNEACSIRPVLTQ